jgi:hypothetical protein
MSASPKDVFRRFGGRRSVDSRKAMARRIAELELLVEQVRTVPRAMVETGFGPVAVVFAHDLDKLFPAQVPETDFGNVEGGAA